MKGIVVKQRRNRIYSIIIFTVLTLGIGSGIVIIEANYRHQQFIELQRSQLRMINLGNELIGREFDVILSDINYFSNIISHQTDLLANETTITNQWITLIDQRKIYQSIKLLDIQGDEVLEVEKSYDRPRVTPNKYLQNQKTNDLFKHALKLSKGDIYVSALTLDNAENIIISPLTPIMKFSTPIYIQNELKGVLVIEYLAGEILNNVQRFSANLTGDTSLLNSMGYWLYHKDITKQWGFILPDREANNFRLEFPFVWEAVTRKRHQLLNNQGLYTFTRIDLRAKLNEINPTSNPIYTQENSWYLVDFVSRTGSEHALFVDQGLPLVKDIIISKAGELTALLLIASIVGYLIYLYQQTYSTLEYYSNYDAMTKVLNRYAGFRELRKLLNNEDKRRFEISICFVDINDLKSINDKFGHDIGDELIINAIEIIKTQIRKDDFVVKMGGDEFLIVFKSIGEGAAEMIWQRINQEFLKFSAEMSLPYVISASHGIVSTWSGSKLDIEALVKAADLKMYEVKKSREQNTYL